MLVFVFTWAHCSAAGEIQLMDLTQVHVVFIQRPKQEFGVTHVLHLFWGTLAQVDLSAG